MLAGIACGEPWYGWKPFRPTEPRSKSITYLDEGGVSSYGPGGVIVMDIDEVWHFLGNKKNKLWIWMAFCRDTGQLVDWQCGDRDQGTLNTLSEGLKTWKVRLYCTDAYICYEQSVPVGKPYQGKNETWRLEQINSRLRHGLARLTACGVASRLGGALWSSRNRLRW